MRPLLIAAVIFFTVLTGLLILAAAVFDLGGPRDEARP